MQYQIINGVCERKDAIEDMTAAVEGSRVRIEGIRTKTEYNGKVGTVVNITLESGTNASKRLFSITSCASSWT